jgi:hypothetical protein
MKNYESTKHSMCLYPNISLNPLAFIRGMKPLAPAFQAIHCMVHFVLCPVSSLRMGGSNSQNMEENQYQHTNFVQ